MKPSVRASSVEGLRRELKDLRRMVMDLQRMGGGSEPPGGTEPEPPGGGSGIPFLVAASNASTESKAAAAYVCDGTDDQDTINLAIAAASAATWSIGRVLLSEGRFNLSAPLDYVWALEGATPGALSGPGATVTELRIESSGPGPLVSAQHLVGISVQVVSSTVTTAVEVYDGSTLGVSIRGSSSTITTGLNVADIKHTLMDVEVGDCDTAIAVSQSGALVSATNVETGSVDVSIDVAVGADVAVSSSILRGDIGIVNGGTLAVAGCIIESLTAGIDNNGTMNSGAAAANTFTGSGTPIV